MLPTRQHKRIKSKTDVSARHSYMLGMQECTMTKTSACFKAGGRACLKSKAVIEQH